MQYDPDACFELLTAIIRQWWTDAQHNGAALLSFEAFTGLDRCELARYARRPLPESTVIRPEVRASTRCEYCGQLIGDVNMRRRFCGTPCRVAAHRRRQHEATGGNRAAAGGDGG